MPYSLSEMYPVWYSSSFRNPSSLCFYTFTMLHIPYAVCNKMLIHCKENPWDLRYTLAAIGNPCYAIHSPAANPVSCIISQNRSSSFVSCSLYLSKTVYFNCLILWCVTSDTIRLLKRHILQSSSLQQYHLLPFMTTFFGTKKHLYEEKCFICHYPSDEQIIQLHLIRNYILRKTRLSADCP